MRFTAAAATAALLAADGALGLRLFVSPIVLGDLSNAAWPVGADPQRLNGIQGVDQLCRVSSNSRFVGLTSAPSRHLPPVGAAQARPNRLIVNAYDRMLNASPLTDFPLKSTFNFATPPTGFRDFTSSKDDMFVNFVVNQQAIAFYNAPYSLPLTGLLGQTQIWSGSDSSGFSVLDSCQSWTAIVRNGPTAFQGAYGALDAIDAEWMNSGSQACTANKSFYCVEQNLYGCLFVTPDAVTMAGAKAEADRVFGGNVPLGRQAIDAYCSAVAGAATPTTYAALTTAPSTESHINLDDGTAMSGGSVNSIYWRFGQNLDAGKNFYYLGNEGSYLIGNLNGQVVGTLRQDLVFRGTLQNTRITDIHAQLVNTGNTKVWTGVTGTLNDGTSAAAKDCNGWTDSTTDFSAYVGDVNSQTNTFVDSEQNCATPAHFYCMSTTIESQSCTGRVKGDPHFRGFDGSKYNFDGQDGEVFAIISDAGFQLNAEFSRMNVRGLDGTWMTKVGVRVGDDTVIVNPAFEGVLRNGELTTSFENQNVKVTSSGSTVTVEALSAGYVATIKSVKFFDVSGTTKAFLDVQVGITQRPVNPHGLLGQTARFLADGSAPAAVVSSGLNGEGVVEGLWTDYIVHDGLVGTDFNFATFDNVVSAKQARSVVDVVVGAFSQ